MKKNEDRRQYQRVKLTRAAPCQIDDRGGFVFDVSLTGALVAHEERDAATRLQGEVKVSWEWEGQPLSFIAQIVRSDLERRETRQGIRRIRRLGISFVRPLGASDQVLQEIIMAHVERALDEQKANARGIPAIAPSSVQTGGGLKGYLICRYRRGRWTRSESESSEQPPDGFTISVSESHQASLLCESYEEADEEGRKMIRQMAEISISEEKGIPTRRYDP